MVGVAKDKPLPVPLERGGRPAQWMWAKEQSTQWLGAELQEIGPVWAELAMTVAPHHLNGHGICHGGFIFTLADSAFAFACNSYNQITVAQENQITFLTPGKPGERLTEACTEQARTGRSGVYDVVVTGEDGRKVALMRGLSRTVKGVHFEEKTDL